MEVLNFNWIWSLHLAVDFYSQLTAREGGAPIMNNKYQVLDTPVKKCG